MTVCIKSQLFYELHLTAGYENVLIVVRNCIYMLIITINSVHTNQLANHYHHHHHHCHR